MGSSVINTLNTCFWVCLVGAILFLLIAVMLFFVFDIRNVISLKRGRAKAKAIKSMEQANAETGRLRVNGMTQTSKLDEKEKKEKRAPAVVPPNSEELQQFMHMSDSGKIGPPPEHDSAQETAALSSGTDETAALTPDDNTGETVALRQDIEVPPAEPDFPEFPETSVLSQPPTKDLGKVNDHASEPKLELHIIKKEIYIHTDEMIS